MTHNACIVSFFMDNINPKTVELQQKVVEKYNVSKYPHYRIGTNLSHGQSMDYFWGLNGVKVDSVASLNIEKKMDFDIIPFLDIDAIPLSEKSIDLYVDRAADSKLVGNAQSSGHINDGKHMFAAPSAVAIHREIFLTIGKPSAIPSTRGDVGEEYTWAAEKAGIKLDLFMPLRYDEPVIRYDWETNREPFWKLSNGIPYGQGTTFGSEELGDLFFHNFQIFQNDNQQKFWARCEKALNE